MKFLLLFYSIVTVACVYSIIASFFMNKNIDEDVIFFIGAITGITIYILIDIIDLI